MEASTQNKTVINLTAGHEDAERVTLAFLVGTAALEQGRQVTTFLNMEAVHLALSGEADTVEWEGAPPLSRLFEQYRDGGGELYVCPICFAARSLDEADLVGNARLAGATPLWEWIGDGAVVFSY